MVMAKKVFSYIEHSGDLAGVECGDHELHFFHWTHCKLYGFGNSIPYNAA